jgi:hypothetical protein
MPPDESNWLDAKIIECGQCGQKLYWVLHSGFYDEDFLYCSRCPKRVEVSRYDETATRVTKLLPERTRARLKEWIQKYFSLIEENLAPCDCGGKFSYWAPRRCLRCAAVLPQSEPNRDLWPPEGANENFDPERDPSSFPLNSLVKSGDIWRK